MHIAGCEIRWPGVTNVVLAAGIGLLLWAAAKALLPVSVTHGMGLMVAILFGCIASECGLSARKGWRAALLFVALSALLVLAAALVAGIQ
jgi:hypothetical protein